MILVIRTREAVYKRVCAVISALTFLDEDEIEGHITLKTLGMDSLDRIELEQALEDELDVRLSTGQSWQTVDDVVKSCCEALDF